MKTLVSFVEARNLVLSGISRVDDETVGLNETLHRTLAQPIFGQDDIPPFDNSAMDGYAVRAEDVPVPGTCLEVVGEIAAGCADPAIVTPGLCVRIMTGAPMPPGANAVLPVETVEVQSGSSVTFSRAAKPGDHVRRAGEDIPKGGRVLEAGQVLGPGEISVLASLGYGRVPVVRRPRVSIVTTGDELIDPSEALRPGKIRNANGVTLAAQVTSAGGRVNARLHAWDTRDHVRSTLEKASDANLLLVSGGVSVGDYDLVREALEHLGTRMVFQRVRQRPGKPFAFGMLGDLPVFGLPGNPVSSAICFEVYVRPTLAKMLKRREILPTLLPAVLESATPKKRGRHSFVRGCARWAEGTLVVEPEARQGSHVASSLVTANGLIHLEEDLGPALAGTTVPFEWFAW